MRGLLRGRKHHHTSELVSYLAAQVGQASLARLAGPAHPVLDQHMAAVSEAMAQILGTDRVHPADMVATLVRYACGFAGAAIEGGWQPPAAGQPLDAESMRLAAICQLISDCG